MRDHRTSRRAGSVVIKIISFLSFVGVCYTLYFCYNNLLVKVVEDYLVFPKSQPSFTHVYFDATKYDLRYFYEKRELISWLIDQPKAEQLEGYEIFSHLVTIEADDYYRFEANMKIFETSNKTLLKNAFASKAKSEKKLIGRMYRWLFGKDADIPDSPDLIKEDEESSAPSSSSEEEEQPEEGKE